MYTNFINKKKDELIPNLCKIVRDKIKLNFKTNYQTALETHKDDPKKLKEVQSFLTQDLKKMSALVDE